MLLIVNNWTLSLIFICNLKYSVHKESSIVFHNESNYEYYLILPYQHNLLVWRKYWRVHSLWVPIQKEVTRSDKNGEGTTKSIFYQLKFIDSTRFIASSSC